MYFKKKYSSDRKIPEHTENIAIAMQGAEWSSFARRNMIWFFGYINVAVKILESQHSATKRDFPVDDQFRANFADALEERQGDSPLAI